MRFVVNGTRVVGVPLTRRQGKVDTSHRLEASMRLEIIISVAVGLWIAVLLLVVSLCHVSRRSDDATRTASADAMLTDGDIEASPSLAAERPLRTLGIVDAASLLDVAPETLLEWDRRYGFPTSSAFERLYNESEILALRDCLEDGLSIASAVSRAREHSKRRRAALASRLLDHRDGGLAS